MKIGILLSGGIDSMMAARLLQEQGHEIIGITMITQENFDLTPAQKAAQWLHIDHHIVDLKKWFQQYVITYFCSTYEKGETPNPCVFCNQYVKLGSLLDIALDLGCEKVATGHYVRLIYEENQKMYALYKGIDSRKDQSYFLYRLGQHALAHLLFPLGEFHKERIREMATERLFPSFVTQRKESQDICFLPSDYREFLQNRVQCRPGTFIDESGKILGQHAGIAWYTIGQRKGLGISAAHPLYVLKLDPKTQQITLGKNEQLFQQQFSLRDCVWATPTNSFPSYPVQVKIRYAAAPVWAQITTETPNNIYVQLDEPQRAITPGQSAVFYDENRVLGGGIIKEIF